MRTEGDSMKINYYQDLLSLRVKNLGMPELGYLYKKCHLKSKTTKCASRHAERAVGLRELEN